MNFDYFTNPQYGTYHGVGKQGVDHAVDGAEVAEIAEIAVTQVNNGTHLDCINSLRFDSAEENLWAGTYYGSLHQFVGPGLETYARLQAHSDAVISLRSNGHSCISVTPNQLSVNLSGCIPHILYNDKIGDLSAVEFDVSRNHRILLGRSQGGISSFDVLNGQIGGTINTGSVGVVALCGPVASGGLVLATADGRISLLDARDGLKQQGSALPAHTGGFAAVDAAGYLVATAGFAARTGRLLLESTVKVFDCRMGLRMLNTLPFPAGPSLVRFDPVRMNALLTASADGMFQFNDATGVSIAGNLSSVSNLLEGTTLISCDVSPSGECIAFGTSAGCIHLFSTVSNRGNACFASEGIFPPMPGDGAMVDRFPVFGLGEDDPISVVPMYFPPHSSHTGGGLASDIGSKEEMSVGLGPRTIPASVLSGGKQADFVFYVDNPKYVRGATPGTAAAAVSVLRNTRLKFQLKSMKADAKAKRAERAAARTAAGLSNIPDRYHQVVIQQQKGSRYEEFDFSRYNKTRFSGLENGLANCYVNSLLQVLFFCRPMHDLLMQHIPDPNSEFNLLDEMSLLFRMLSTARGQVCQAANLLRALRQSKEALALGLLEGVRGERGAADIEVEAHKDKSLARRTQRLCRFLLETMNKEASSRESSKTCSKTEIERIFALFQIQRLKCLSHPDQPVQQKIARVFQVDLKYPDPKSGPVEPGAGHRKHQKEQSSRPSFGDVLAQSLLISTELRAWFNADLGYQMVCQDRIPCEVPDILVVACGLESEDDLLHWWQPLKDCKEGKDDGEARPWLPFSFSLRIDTQHGNIEIKEKEMMGDEKLSEPASWSSDVEAAFSLAAVIAHVREEEEETSVARGESQEGHLVAHIKIPSAYYMSESNKRKDTSDDTSVASPEDSWVLFNDFSITSCSLSEVRELYDGQKVPVLLFFEKVFSPSTGKDVSESPLNLPLVSAVPVLSDTAFLELCHENTTGEPTESFVPLRQDELPISTGQLFALDAEFVAYSPPETLVRRGTDIETRPSRLGLGRISVVRGEGPLAGTPCIDDYIKSVEPVYDYLTRYSGLKPGDLDPSTSTHHLTTLRQAYLKLEYLVEAGGVFIGHGLKQDFRMLNIVVPSTQIIDTVDLYHQGHGRRLSLRFLAAYVLKTTIQEGIHDSIEDASIALKLYQEYKKMEADGIIHEVIAGMYEWGVVHGWDPTKWDAVPSC